MRQKSIRSETQNPRSRTSLAEPMEESLARKRVCIKFTLEEIAYIIKRRNELILDGLKDKQIAKILAPEMKRSLDSLYIKISQLIHNSQIPENPNKTEQYKFTEDEINVVILKVNALSQSRLNDTQLSKKIGEEIGRSASSVLKLITRLIKNKKLPENLNKQEDYSDKNVQKIIDKCKVFFSQGYTIRESARELAKVLKQSEGSLREKIRRLIIQRKLPTNLNVDKKRFKDKDFEFIKSRRQVLIGKGLKDSQICRIIAKEMKRPKNSINNVVRSKVKEGVFQKNPNKQEQTKFTNEEIQTIKRKYEELVQKGLNDKKIFSLLADDVGRCEVSIQKLIYRLRENNEVSVNPYCRDINKFTAEEINFLIRRRPELILDRLNDNQVAKILAKEMNRSVYSINQKIVNLVREGILPSNPNKQGVKPTESEILAQLKNAVELYLGKGEKG